MAVINIVNNLDCFAEEFKGITLHGKKIEKAEFESIKRENDKLKQELTYASRRVIALETMIDVAEKELKINLRKKSSTRQSKRSDKEIK